MNLNKMFVFIFVFFLLFAVLLVTMPTDFLILGIGAEVQDKEAADYFNQQNVTVYNYTLSFNLTYGSGEEFAYGLPDPQKLYFFWSDFFESIGINHLVANIWGWWYDSHQLLILEPYKSHDTGHSNMLSKADLLALWNEDYNASYCEFACSHVAVKLFILTYNQSWTLSESYDNGKLKLVSSYMIDWTETGTSMWSVMMQLLAFQNPNLGIPGIFGQILTVGFGGALWASIAILAFALITSVIPTISGWRGD